MGGMLEDIIPDFKVVWKKDYRLSCLRDQAGVVND